MSFLGIWSPTQKVSEEKTEIKEENLERKKLEDEPIQPVWTPKSAQASPVLEKKEFRPVNFESTTLSRKNYTQDVSIQMNKQIFVKWKRIKFFGLF